MTKPSSWSAPDNESGPFDIVGDRVLAGVQVVNISRLSTHPIPVTPQGLVTIAGQGPKDSNGAGKSSLIAAISLLHADEQWRLATGASGTAELLFTAELAAQEGRWSNVDWGYVIGVFTDPNVTAPEELSDNALTVWLRINRKASHLHLRWHYGLYVPYGSTESERAASVDKLWDALPTSNGRTDFHANRLSTVLYGGHVRCVSFLSTSVRSTPAANLLAQPLNDLDPRRIFDAIATLTGVDGELEQEQKLRSAEHAHRTQVSEAEDDLQRWKDEMAVVEDGIVERDRARQLLGDADTAWHGRCARHLVDGLARDNDIAADLAELRDRATELRSQIETAEDVLAGLKSDEKLDRRFQEAEAHWKELDERDRKLDADHRVIAQELDGLTGKHRDLLDKARAADGRTLVEARAEKSDAESHFEEALAARGIAAKAEEQAREQMQAAESGDDLAAPELAALREASIPSVALLDIIQLTASQRRNWEPRLAPYRSAVVVTRADSTRAQQTLTKRPGAVIVIADPSTKPAPAAGADVPLCTDTRFDLTTFLTAIAGRVGDGPNVVDAAAGVIVLGDFHEPITGRSARIAAARSEHQNKADLLSQAEGALATARRILERATERVGAAESHEEAHKLEKTIADKRAANEDREERRNKLKPILDVAYQAYTMALGDRQTRDMQIQTLEGTKKRLNQELTNNGVRATKLTDERRSLDLPGRQTAWGDSHQTAETYLLSLDAEHQQRPISSWNEEVCHQVNEVVRRCFPDGTPPEEIPSELRELLVEQRWHRGGLDTRIPLVPSLIRALRSHLALTEQHDNYEREQIAVQRAHRTGALEAARSGLNEAEQTSRAHRASLAQGIKARLKKVSDEFDRLDQKYGGYGAGLDYPEPEPPSEPDRPWRWTVTPKWRRDEGKRMASYNLRGNTAQMDEKAVKLVCAAALAGGGSRPLVLVLDELGRNLGKQHRREAVALFEQIGADRNITVIGALQDDMERYAIEASGLYIKLRRRSDSMAYNEAPVVVGDDANHARVELLREWLASYRSDEDDAARGEGEDVA